MMDMSRFQLKSEPEVVALQPIPLPDGKTHWMPIYKYPQRPGLWWQGIVQLACGHIRELVLGWDVAEMPEEVACLTCADLPERHISRFAEWDNR